MGFLEGIDQSLLKNEPQNEAAKSKKSLPPQSKKAEEIFMKSQTERESVKHHKVLPKQQSRRQSQYQDEVALGEKIDSAA